MNIFYLDPNPTLAAQYHVDKHVVKMILESAQLLSTAHFVLDGNSEGMYKPTHINHPCSKWVRESRSNYIWLHELFEALSFEYTHRYGKVHNTYIKMNIVLSIPPINIIEKGFTMPAQAMPDVYKNYDSINAYRAYYINEKYRFAHWKKREVPIWFKNSCEVNNYANL